MVYSRICRYTLLITASRGFYFGEMSSETIIYGGCFNSGGYRDSIAMEEQNLFFCVMSQRADAVKVTSKENGALTIED